MKRIFTLFIIIVIGVNQTAHSASFQGVIEGYTFYEFPSGKKSIFFQIKDYDAASSNPSTCNTTDRFVIDDTTSIFEYVSSSIMSAYHSGETVKVNYDALCSIASTTYTANYVCVGSMSTC